MSDSYRDKLLAALGYDEAQPTAAPPTIKPKLSTASEALLGGLSEGLKEIGNAAVEALAKMTAELAKTTNRASYNIHRLDRWSTYPLSPEHLKLKWRTENE